MKTFVDNVAIQVIEASIISKLPDVFNPLAVAQMTNEFISKIAAESQENQTQREMLQRKIHILEELLREYYLRKQADIVTALTASCHILPLIFSCLGLRLYV